MSKGGDQRTHRVAASQLVQELKLVLDPIGAAGDVDLLDGNELWVPSAARPVVSTPHRSQGIVRPALLQGRGRPLGVLLLFQVPVVAIGIVVEILGFVDGGESPWSSTTRSVTNPSL